ncbi:hypothetical protein DEO72_LG2g3098 [Vigna unguiculata]|uniref:Uncharacterized protein n=1 Tax=Vigna unguiculata TaxID=3917 RepID=A0A4D6L2J9_VIGUN|nr:hypothetical protein DEO72_LG2g3098 [Vigna unguiculata]
MLVTSPARLLAGREEELWRWSHKGKWLPWMRVKEKTLAPRVHDRRNEKGGDFGGRFLVGDASDGCWRQRRRGVAVWWHGAVVRRLWIVEGRRQRVSV